jgi:neutral ceramidase
VPAEPLLEANEALLAGRSRHASLRLTPRPVRELPPVRELLAGASAVDITPPPGMPKAGYSRNTGDGRGFRTRLRARVLHLRGGTSSIALVALDLLGGSQVVQHLVAEAIAARTDVPLAGLFLGATHTHAAPGQFVGSAFYNRFASNRSGFDPSWTQFLVGQITAAVIQAVETRQPARMAYGSDEVYGFTRNRSLAARLHRASPGLPRGGPFEEIDPQLHLLRVDTVAAAGGFEPLAAFAVFGIHGTGVCQRSRDYNADVWAYVIGELEDRIEARTGIRPVCGAVQGAHGDLAPAVTPGRAGYPEAKRIGRGVGAAAAMLHQRLESTLTGDVVLGAGLRELDMIAGAGRVGEFRLPPPALGCAQLAGAWENLTPVLHRVPPFRPGCPQPRPERRPHGAKWRVAGRLHDRLLPGLPRVLPAQVLRIGPMLLLGLPFEVTADAGRRIRAAVRSAAAGHGFDDCVLSSVANEYAGYCTTPEEYALQFYEGGHTLHGPQTQPWAARVAAGLVTDVLRNGTVADVLPERRFELPMHRYLARSGGPMQERSIDRGGVEYAGSSVEDPYVELRWSDVAPGDLNWSDPLAGIERQARDGSWVPARQANRPLDDGGWDLGVLALGVESGRHRYAIRWFGTADTSRGQVPYRLVLAANNGRPRRTGEPFFRTG